MALSHKDWELPNFTNLILKVDYIFPSRLASRLVMFGSEKVAN